VTQQSAHFRGAGGSDVLNLPEAASAYIQRRYMGTKGFSASNIWRMRQIYDTYQANPHLAALLREITWANNLLIMASAKTDEVREFCLRIAIRDRLSSRELEPKVSDPNGSLMVSMDSITSPMNRIICTTGANLGVCVRPSASIQTFKPAQKPCGVPNTSACHEPSTPWRGPAWPVSRRHRDHSNNGPTPWDCGSMSATWPKPSTCSTGPTADDR